MLAEVLRQDDDWFDACHNYIQWLFPTREYSRVTPDAPVLEMVTIDAFLSDSLLRQHLRAAFNRILSFYGLAPTASGIVKRLNWGERKSNWLTRTLKSLFALGLEADAKAFQSALKHLYETEADRGVALVSVKFWMDAL